VLTSVWAGRVVAGLAVMAGAMGCAGAAAQSRWAHMSKNGRLVYATTAKGDRIPDFSNAGYEGGGVALPHVPAKRRVAPSGGDDTAAIQQAIDAVAAMPLTGKFRGAVELAAGTYHCSTPLTIAASGVVLRGAGAGKGGTVIAMTGSPHVALRLEGRLEQTLTGVTTEITDAYVPAGAMSFDVADAKGLKAGDTVVIRKPVTAQWVHFMGMDDLHRNGKDEHWVSAKYLEVRRTVAAVKGKRVRLTVPLMDNYDAGFFDGGRAQVEKVEVSGQIEQVGVEGLRIEAPPRSIALGEAAFGGMQVRDVKDGWVRGVTWEDTTNGVGINAGSERMTFVDCAIDQHVPVTSHAKPADFAVDGGQILLERCTGSGDSTFYVVTQDREQGPVVALDCRFTGNGHIEPHQRWFTGLLVDNCAVPEGAIDLMNRGEMGSGHGWAIGWSVVWNSEAKELGMNTPPGTMIWSIGNRGEETDPKFPVYDGGPARAALQPATIERAGEPVKPRSLYIEQLRERLGERAVKAIGY
jgi:hypothetical protein